MEIGIDLRSLMTGGKISGVENYLVNILNRWNFPGTFGFYNSHSDVAFPFLRGDLKIKNTRIPNKIFSIALSWFNLPKFEKLYGGMDAVWMPDLRPFALKKKTKLAITVHDLSPVVHPEFYSLKMRIWHKLNRHEKSYKRADKIFAVSEYTKNDLINICGIAPERISVVYPGINHELFRPDYSTVQKDELKKRLGLPQNYILSISTVEPRKNILSLIKSFELIDDSQLALVIAGKLGWVYGDIIEAVNNSPKKNKIKLLGYVDEKDKPLLIAGAFMVCYPSFYEGFGFVPLEAMACGVPVITSARTSMPEVCADAALLIEPYHLEDLAAAIKSLLADAQLRESLIQKGLMRSKLFTWDKCVEQIQNQLKELAYADRA